MARPPVTADSELQERLVFAEAMGHPVRGRVMAALCERPDVTIRQLAERLDEPPRRIRHQVDALVASGLVEITGEDLRRGVIERRYGIDDPANVESIDGLGPDLRVRIATSVVRLLLADVTVAVRAGTFATRSDSFELRFYGEVDEACMEELVEVHMRAYRDIEETIEAGKKRIRESGEPGTEVVSALFLFEAPLWGPRDPGGAADDG